MPSNNRPAIHAYLSAEAKDAWELFTVENGVSMTGLLEALGIELAEEMKHSQPDEVWQDRIKKGRRIDADRRRRK